MYIQNQKHLKGINDYVSNTHIRMSELIRKRTQKYMSNSKERPNKELHFADIS